jgi:hypothetical protein
MGWVISRLDVGSPMALKRTPDRAWCDVHGRRVEPDERVLRV